MALVKIEVETLSVCRICLQSCEEEMASIFDRDPANDTLCIYEKIEKSADIKILTDPELPTRICQKCHAFLTIAYKFRVICRNSDDYLREFVCKATRRTDEEDDGIGYLLNFKQEQINNNNNNDEDKNDLQELDDSFNLNTEAVTQTLKPNSVQLNDEEEAIIDYEEIDNFSDLFLLEDEHNAENIMDAIEENAILEIDQQIVNDNNVQCEAKTTDAMEMRVKTVRQIARRNGVKQSHICEICGNSYPRKYALDAHMRRHRDERPFECEICHQSFHMNFQLTRHIRKHTGQRPYSCQFCKRSFADRSTLVKHERIHRNERPYTCETCGKTFTYSSVLKVHQLTHTGEKPFTCGICKKRFARSHHLRAHLETLLHSTDPRAKVLLTKIKREEELGLTDAYIII